MARFGKRSSESINLNCGEPTVRANDDVSNCKSTMGKSGLFKFAVLYTFTVAKILIVSCDRCRQFRRGEGILLDHILRFTLHIAFNLKLDMQFLHESFG